MHFSSLIAAGALAAQASAFLVIPETADAPDAPTPSIVTEDPRSANVQIPCRDCNFHSDKEQGHKETVLLSFAVNEDNHLTLNGESIFPVSNQNSVDLRAPIRAGDSDTKPLQLGFALEVLPASQSQDDGSRLYPIHFTVVDVDGHTSQVDTAVVYALQTPEGDLLISKVEKICFTKHTPGAQCKTSMCRLRALFLYRLHQLIEAAKKGATKLGIRPCHAKGSPMGVPEKFNPTEEQAHASSSSHPSHHHGHPMHHGHHSKASHFMHNAIRLFVIPAMLGVIGGLTACAIGTIVGQLIAFLWIRFFRGGRRGAIRVEEAGAPSEKVALVTEEQDLPPQYTDNEDVETAEKE
ncbi:MAG: hypothetical protein Q9227_007340 [Pyrenula ochraceoflavens]